MILLIKKQLSTKPAKKKHKKGSLEYYRNLSKNEKNEKRNYAYNRNKSMSGMVNEERRKKCLKNMKKLYFYKRKYQSNIY